MNRSCPVIVMAKAPVAGYAKTRLIPALGAAGAARLAERMLQHALQQAVAADLGPVELCVAPDSHHPVITALAESMPLSLRVQGPGDLGTRMIRAFARALVPPTGFALLIGTDAPALDAAMLRSAAQALLTHDAVFVPAHDGGYALVGLRRLEPALFDDMTWSVPTVMKRTRERLSALDMRHVELPPVADIDEPADLANLPAGWLEGWMAPQASDSSNRMTTAPGDPS